MNIFKDPRHPTTSTYDEIIDSERREQALTDAYAAGREDERADHKALRDAVEQIIDAGHMNTEDLARLRAAWDNT